MSELTESSLPRMKNKREKTFNISRKLRIRLERAGLTPREKEVASLARGGINNREIAFKLFISSNTVCNHVKKIHKKLKVHSRGELVALLNQ